MQRRSRFIGNQTTLLRTLSNACLFSGTKFFIGLFYVFGFLFAQLSSCLRPGYVSAGRGHGRVFVGRLVPLPPSASVERSGATATSSFSLGEQASLEGWVDEPYRAEGRP